MGNNISYEYVFDKLYKKDNKYSKELLNTYFNEIANKLKNKKILVTGGAGSIGREIVKNLLQFPISKVIVVTRAEKSIYQMQQFIGDNERIIYQLCDVKNDRKLSNIFSKYRPDIVFHGAAHKHVTFMENHPDEAITNNIIGTYNCAYNSIKFDVSEFYLISTDKAVNPISIMGLTKRISELIVFSLNKIYKNVHMRCVRFGNVINSDGSFLKTFISQIKNKQSITITDPLVKRFFMTIPEAVSLILHSLIIENSDLYILNMGDQINIMNIAKMLISEIGDNNEKYDIEIIGLREGEKLSEELFYDYEEAIISKNPKIYSVKHNSILFSEERLQKIINDIKDISVLKDIKLMKKILFEYYNKNLIKTKEMVIL